MPEPGIALAVTPRRWSDRLHRHVSDHGGANVVAKVINDRSALSADYSVLFADELAAFLTPEFTDALRGSRRRTIGMYDRETPQSRADLEDAGCDHVIADDTHPDELLALAADLDVLTPKVGRAGLSGPDAIAPTFADGADEFDALALDPSDDLPEGLSRRAAVAGRSGAVLVVIAASAGAGATETAVAAAMTLSKQGPTVLIDADVVAPGLAQRLSLPQHPNIRRASSLDDASADQLRDVLLPAADERISVLPGLTSARDWTELPVHRVRQFVQNLASVYDYVVVNIASSTEELPSRQGPGRNEVTQRLLADADAVVVVTHANTGGVAKLLSWKKEADLYLSDSPVHLLCNRFERGSFHEAELRDELSQHLALPSVTFAPNDRRVTAAEWSGSVVPDAAPFAKAVESMIVTHVAPPRRTAKRKGGRR